MFSKNIEFSTAEEEVIKFWNETDAFNAGNKLSRDRPAYVFYDGPPFATGLPHYGHILSGTIKDTVGRFYYQQGFHVSRRFGWDCHGLPVEYEIDKKLGITDRQQVLDMGIDKYNEECESIVMKYSTEWEKTVTRMGRWVDFKGGYKTMNPEFMESTWFIFNQLFQRNKVYRGFRIMPFSTACKTPLSNFEANQNYKDVSDPSILIAFPLIENTIFKDKSCKISLVAWTTTPWTLPANCGLIVNRNLKYSIVSINEDSENLYILQEDRVLEYFYSFAVKGTVMGSDLVGLSYKQPFDFFEDKRSKGFFKILAAEFVSETNGTAIVHCAPAFGEEDYNTFIKEGLITEEEIVPCPVDENGKFTLDPYKGIYIKDLDKIILKDIKDKILMNSRIVHSYPFCWRSDTPLIYKLVPNWFIKVKESIEALLENNEKINWIPGDIKYKRFHNWLANARDWAVSRNRFWGTPIPIWVRIQDDGNLDYTDLLCIGSLKELEELSGEKVNNLHRQFIDHIIIEKNNKKYKRIEEVLDCWFESGSMPYSQDHWPFNENCEEKTPDAFLQRKNFPAEFIGEGLDQTRGWFYTLHVIATLLFNQPAFKNVVVNGIVLAEDGKKMSKRLKNYPDPDLIFKKYGADALRMYLVSSPVVEAENLRFNENGVKDMLKVLLIPWYNTLVFFMECDLSHSELFMDQWILDSFSNFNFKVSETMKKYNLNSVLPEALKFLDDLSNWYVRINRKDLRAGGYLLGKLLKDFSITMAAFTPFFSEYCYQSILSKMNDLDKEPVSVHHCIMNATKATENDFENAKNVIEGIRQMREIYSLKLKRPLSSVTIACSPKIQKILKNYISVIKSECNVIDLFFKNEDEFKFIFSIKPCFSSLSKDKETMKEKIDQIRKISQEDAQKVLGGENLIIEKLKNLRISDLIIEKKFEGVDHSMVYKEIGFILDTSENDTIKDMTLARDFNSFIQKLRKNNSLKIEDSISIKIFNSKIIEVSKKYYPDLIFTVESDQKRAGEGNYSYEDIEEAVELFFIE